MQERIKLMYKTQDPNIIFDLRKNGGFKGTKFDEFWDEMDGYFNKVNIIKLQILINNINIKCIYNFRSFRRYMNDDILQ